MTLAQTAHPLTAATLQDNQPVNSELVILVIELMTVPIAVPAPLPAVGINGFGRIGEPTNGGPSASG
jgi:hypothetical protein